MLLYTLINFLQKYVNLQSFLLVTTKILQILQVSKFPFNSTKADSNPGKRACTHLVWEHKLALACQKEQV